MGNLASGPTNLRPHETSGTEYHVSSGGSDSLNSGSKKRPFRTVTFALQQAGKVEVGNVFILLRSGDDFTGEGRIDIRGIAGLSIGTNDIEPARLGKIKVTSSPSIVIRNIHSNGGLTATDSYDVCIDGCTFSVGGTGVDIVRCDGFTFTGNLVEKQAPETEGGKRSGLHVAETVRVTIDNCIFNHNGFLKEDRSDATSFNHNVYIQTDCADVRFTRNISANASSHGCHHRCGGLNEDNLYINNPINLQFGYSSGVGNPGPFTGTVRSNVFSGWADINPSLPRGIGLTLEATELSEVYNNLFIPDRFGHVHASARAIQFSGRNYVPVHRGTHVWENTIVEWGGNPSITANRLVGNGEGMDAGYEKCMIDNNLVGEGGVEDRSDSGDEIKWLNNRESGYKFWANGTTLSDAAQGTLMSGSSLDEIIDAWVESWRVPAVISNVREFLMAAYGLEVRDE